jgi:hypothetical protein
MKPVPDSPALIREADELFRKGSDTLDITKYLTGKCGRKFREADVSRYVTLGRCARLGIGIVTQ